MSSRNAYGECETDDGREEESDEGGVIPSSNAVIQEGTVMIRLLGADITESAVGGPRRPIGLACLAPCMQRMVISITFRITSVDGRKTYIYC